MHPETHLARQQVVGSGWNIREGVFRRTNRRHPNNRFSFRNRSRKQPHKRNIAAVIWWVHCAHRQLMRCCDGALTVLKLGGATAQPQEHTPGFKRLPAIIARRATRMLFEGAGEGR